MLREDFKDAIPETPLRKYRLLENEDGTISLEDETTYTQVGDRFSAGVLNAVTHEINEKFSLVVSEVDIPVAERSANTLYFFVRETQSGGGGLPENVTVSPNMALKPVDGTSKSGIDFN